jgi:hypothetical protein
MENIPLSEVASIEHCIPPEDIEGLHILGSSTSVVVKLLEPSLSIE